MLIIKKSNNPNLARYNPIRYRGYYYDVDTGLYYCNSRYYNPEWGRWISPDDTAYLNPETPDGLNLYVYCNNDPINNVDPSGNVVLSTLLIGALVGFGVSFASSVITQAVFTQDVNITTALIDGAFGAVMGIFSATGIGAIATGFINGGLTLANGVITTGVENNWEFSTYDIISIAGSAVLSGVFSGIAKHKSIKTIRETNRYSKTVRGRIASGYYKKSGHMAKSIASATHMANKQILNIHFNSKSTQDYLITLAESVVNGFLDLIFG